MQVTRIRGHAYALVVYPDLFVCLQIVPHKHLLLTTDQCGADLHGGEPIDVYVSDDFLRKVDGDERHVLDAVQMFLAGSYNSFRLLADHVVHDREIMWREVPDHVYVVLEQAQIHAKRIVVVKISHRSIIHQLPDLLYGAREEEGVVHHNAQILPFGQLNQFLCLSYAGREGLVNEDMFTVLQSGLSYFEVRPDWRDHRYDIDTRGFNDLHRIRGERNSRMCLFQAFLSLGVLVAH